MVYNVDRNMTIDDRLMKAKILLQDTHPFFAFVLSNMKLIKADEKILHGNPIGVNAKGEVFYDEKVVANEDITILKSLLCHEAMHVVLYHLLRGKSRQHVRWNIAIDLAVNDMLVQNNFNMMKGGLIPQNHTFSYEDVTVENIDKKTAEEIYKEIPEQMEDKLRELIKQVMDTHMFSEPSKDPNESQEEQVKWDQLVIDGWNHAIMKGKEPAGMKRLIDGILKPKLPWKHLLHKYITQEIMTDFNWSYPSKRSIATGYYMPSLKRENIDIVATVDTSGSIDQKILTAFLSEIVAIAKSFENIKATVLLGDCEIQNVLTVENGNIAKILNTEVKGGGGTSHIPFYEWVEKNRQDCKLIINLTDGYTDFPSKPEHTKFNTMWILTNKDAKVPFGTPIVVEEMND